MHAILKLRFLVLGALLSSILSYGQNDFTLYNMTAIPQVTLTNPATLPSNRLNIGIPVIGGIYQSFGNSGFTLGEAFEVNEAGQTVVDVENLKSVLNEVNYITSRTSLDLMMVGFRVGNNYFHLHARNLTDVTFRYPKDAFIFLVEGNGESFLGQRASFDGFGLDIISYNEYSFGYTRRINQRITLGGRFKYLQGIGSVFTKESQFGITTARDYTLSLDGAFEVNTAGVDNFDIQENLLGFKNNGIGFDLGARVKITEQLALSASAIDVGSINWTDNVKSYLQQETSFTFSGIDIGSLVDPDTGSLGSNAFDQLLDSLTETVDIEETETEFTTPLTPKFYLGGTYNITSRIQLSALTFNQIIKGNLRTSASIGLNTSLGNIATASVNYSAFGNSLGNVGVGGSVNLGPVQVYLLTDNILAPINYDQRKNFHFRFGINVTTGRDYEFN